jgi:hypothetical protein
VYDSPLGKLFAGIRFAFATTLKYWIPIGIAVTSLVTVLSVFGWKTAYLHSGERQNKVQKIKMIISHSEEIAFLKRNIGKIKVGSARQRHVNFVFVKGNVILLNAHVFWALDKGTEYVADGTDVTLMIDGQEDFHFPFEKAQMSLIDEDLALIQLPARVASRSTITQHFWDGDLNLGQREAVMFRKTMTDLETIYGKILEDRVQVVYTQTKGGEEVEVQSHDSCLTNLPSKPGDCGSIVIVPTGCPNTFKIVGINIGSGPQGSITKFVTKAMINEGLRKFQIFERAELHSDWRKPEIQEIEASGFANAALVVHAISNKEISVPRKSKIVPSPLHDRIVPVFTDVCILNMNDRRLNGINVFKENMKKYGDPSKPFPADLVKQASDSIISELNAKKTISLKRCLTTFEAINGVPGYPFLTAMEMSTAAAFPFCLEGILGEKRQLFVGEPGKYVPNSILQHHIDIIESRIKDNILPDYPFMNTIKDERKDKEDVAKGKSRMFSMASVALTIVQRKYCLPIIAHLYQCRHNSFLSIGINKASKEWDQLVRYLLEVGDQFSDADYKKFDTRANLEVRLACNRIFEQKWMTNEEQSRVRVLMRYDSQALHQWGKYILALPSGTSSGSFVTATIGSIINECYIRMAWIHLMPHGFKDIAVYRKYVRTKNYGDDLAMSTHRDICEDFHPQKIADFLECYNIQMTSGDKHSALGFKSVTDFTFLKNKTKLFHGSYVPIQQDPCEPINWIRVGMNSEPPEVACEANCNSVLRTLFFYGEKYFNEIRDKILELKDYNLISYPALLAEWFEIGELSDPDGTFTFSEGRQKISTALEKSKKLASQPPLNFKDGHSEQPNMNYEIIDKIYKIELHSGVQPEGSQGTLDDPAAVSDSKFGTITTDQTSPAMTARVEGRATATTSRSSRYNPDGIWDLAKMLGRWNYVDTVTWSASQAAGTNIKTFDVLRDLLTSEIATVPFQRFNLNRFDQLQIKLETIGYRYARGRLLVVFRPTQRTGEFITTPPTISDAIVLGAVSLDPTAATIAQINIDFTYYKQYLDLVNGDCLGQLHFIVQNTFVPGTAGTSECSVKIFFALTQAMFKQPRFGEASYATHLLPLRIDSHSGLIDEGAKALKGLVHDILPDNIVGDVLGGLLDAPQLGEQIPPLVNKEVQYFNNSRNPQYVDVLTLDPSSQQLVDKDVFSTGVNEMMIPELLKKSQFIKTVTWTAANTVGTVLFAENVGPMSDVPIPAIGTFVVGILSYISSFFTYWRGSVIYFIEIVGTQFHEGKVDFCFHPQISATAASALTYKSKLSQYFRTVHVRNGGNVFAFRTIYPGDTPVKKVYNGVTLADSPVPGQRRFQDYFNGAVTLSVSTLLNAPESVQPNVEINIYKMAGKDFELFMNTAHGSSIQPNGYAPDTSARRIISHSGEEEGTINRNTNWFEMPCETLGVGPNEASDIPQSQFGEYFKSLRDVCKRYTLNSFGKIEVPLTAEGGAIAGNNPLTLVLAYGSSNTGKTFIGKISPLFRNFRGAMVHKFRIRVMYQKAAGTPIEIPFSGLITQIPTPDPSMSIQTAYTVDSHFLNAQPHAYISDKQIAEFKAPFLSTRTSCLVEKSWEEPFTVYENEALANTTLNVLLWPVFPQGTTEADNLDIYLDWWIATADEATYGVFIGIPPVQIALTGGGLCINPDYWPVTALSRQPKPPR